MPDHLITCTTEMRFKFIINSSPEMRFHHQKALERFGSIIAIHMAATNVVELEGVVQPAPAPRFSRTQGEIQGPAAMAGEHTREVLSAWNFTDQEIGELQASGAI